MQSIYDNHTWDLVPLPPGRTPITTKWVYKVKRDHAGNIAKLKARLVARGFQQKEGEDFEETFAPVVKWNTLRTLVALAAHRGWKIFHLDAVTAFLNGDIIQDLYIEQPEGYVVPGKEEFVCKLLKALYGLKQAPRAWYSKIDSFLSEKGLLKSDADYNLYYFEEGGRIAILILYVDDLYMTGDHVEKINWLREEIKKQFSMTDLGILTHSLGIEFIFHEYGITMTQRRYITTTLEEFGLIDCNSSPTPMLEGTKLKIDMEQPYVDAKLYQRMVGKLIYLTQSRPDIAYSVSIVSRYMNRPQVPHMLAVKHIFRYLKGTKNLGLCYKQGDSDILTGYADADWAGDLQDRKSTTGYLFRLGETPITWNSKKQTTVALSSTEAEYMALTEGTKEAIWLRRLLQEIQVLQDTTPTMIFGDNQGSLKLAHNPVFHSRTKHVDVRHHFIREKVESGQVTLDYISTRDQLADILTKPLGKITFERLRAQLGLEWITN